MARALTVGVLELVARHGASEWAPWPGLPPFGHRVASLVPQAIAAWARQMGHRVTYAIWHGQAEPTDLLPGDLDLAVIATGTEGSALAYALARLYRQRRARTVVVGSHASRFPRDCARFFDVTVTRCDRDLLAAILGQEARPGTILASDRPPADLPSVEERLPELKASVLAGGWRRFAPVVPLAAGTGWADPDGARTPRPPGALAADLAFVSRHLPGALLAFQDPDLGPHLDESLDLLEAIPPERRGRFLMRCSMGMLTRERQRRLAQTRCLHVTTGIGSSGGHGLAPGLGGGVAGEGARMADAFVALRRHVPGLQAEIVLGLAGDRGEEPFTSARDLLRSLPFIWPDITIATPLRDGAAQDGRLLEAMPLALSCSPYLAMVPRHYEPLEFYERLVPLMEAAIAPRLTLRRLALRDPAAIRLARLSRTVTARQDLGQMRAVRDLLRADPAMRAFHAGRATDLPAHYAALIARRLGHYRDLLKPADLRPLHGAPVMLAPRQTGRGTPEMLVQAAE